MIDPEVQKSIDSITKLQQIGTSPIDIKTFKQDTKATIKANNAAIEAAKAQNATALDTDLKKRTLRTNVPTRVLSGDKVKSIDKVTQSLREDGFVSLGTEKQPDPDQPGLQLTAKQQRIFKSTGMIKGEFSNGDIIRWMKRAQKGEEDSVFNRLREDGKTPVWPVNKITGEKKSIEGFKTAINQSWKNANIDAKIEVNKNGGWEFHRGHGVPASDFGSNWKDNLASQPAFALEKGGEIGPRGMTANVQQSDLQLKSTRSLQDAGIDGVDLKGAFAAYLLEDEPNIMHYMNRTDPRSRGQVLHGVDSENKPLNPETEVLKAEARTNLRTQIESDFEQIKKNNPVVKPSNEEKFKADLLSKNPSLPDTRGLQRNTSSTRSFHDRIKNHLQSKGFQREAARVAGQSPIPWANVAGDFVGVIYDGMAFAADPDLQNGIELFMSGTQAITSGVGAALIAVPEPTTSGLGYVIMRAGDQVGRLERLWNMQRENISISTGKIDPANLIKIKGRKTSKIK